MDAPSVAPARRRPSFVAGSVYVFERIMPDPFVLAIGLPALVAAAACELAVVPAEDLFGLDEAPNLPGTIDQHPNWRRRYAASADTLFADPAVRRRVAILRDHRP